jgi:hypothetical protein
MGERLHTARAAEAMVDDPIAELIIGESRRAAEQPEVVRRHDGLPEAAFQADRAAAFGRPCRESISASKWTAPQWQLPV